MRKKKKEKSDEIGKTEKIMERTKKTQGKKGN